MIDFYNATPAPGQIIGMHLDVRPALDSPGVSAGEGRRPCAATSCVWRWMFGGELHLLLPRLSEPEFFLTSSIAGAL